jgi:hypothetical protein
MGKIWVLDTETKGTGAQMVPLEKVLSEPAPRRQRHTARKPQPRRRGSEPRQPPKFKLVDVMTRQTLAEGAGTRKTVELLKDIRSIVDVSVYVAEGDGWRPLTLGERKALWALRAP